MPEWNLKAFRILILTRLTIICLLSLPFLNLFFLSLPLSAQAEQLSFEEVIDRATDTSFDLQIAALTSSISQKDVTIARSAYLPTIKGSLNSEYLKGLGDNSRQNNFAVVGNNTIPSGTRYQNSMGASVSQIVFDFGAQAQKIKIAKAEAESKKISEAQTGRDLKMKLVELYTEALTQYKILRAKEQLIPVYQLTYQMKKRLFDAGKVSKVELSEEAIQLAQALDESETVRHQFEESLDAISYFTHQSYDPKDTEVENFSDEGDKVAAIDLDLEKTPEFKITELEIVKKQKEVSYIKRQLLPQVSVYSYYNLYGSNPDRWGKSVNDIQNRSLSAGLSITVPVFDGFKTVTEIKKGELEIEKLQVERMKKLSEVTYQYQKQQKAALAYGESTNKKLDIIQKAAEKIDMLSRLTDQELIEKSVVLKEAASGIQKQLELEKNEIQRLSTLKKLKLMQEG